MTGRLSDRFFCPIVWTFSGRRVVMVMVAPASSMIGKTVKQVSFQTQLGGVVLSVSSNGQRIQQKVDSIVLRAGVLCY